ncbi:MAG: DUF6165 family protein [Pseudomonadota bacterium]|nr:DUF6165 family protein [Pseudomonadota bacterium]MEC8877514.1 DUF6165 family protein [Pseudomonadota bacterium]MED5339799.1 DUF6165 family protein [Pseudomonadota bacterium]MEE3206242.1 DUF6165 family protein [Pseudomonadota bacterium]MEE3260461.1 DUF6165 family protein [Pseudomonadota bacterium]|tara:strand:+ start:695 stop:1084 length:390 start_codon:yes stop_codon:yes gene_type:complete
MSIKIQISPGELIDKFTILDIKLNRIKEKEKTQNIRKEHKILKRQIEKNLPKSKRLSALISKLKTINKTLWDIEDQIRVCERKQDFEKKFIKLARSVYQKNDLRSSYKREINKLLGSEIIEEKSYESYS